MSQSFFKNQEKFLTDYLSVAREEKATLDENTLYSAVLEQLVSHSNAEFILSKDQTILQQPVTFRFDRSVGIDVEGDNGNVETLWQYLDMKEN